MKKSPLLFPVVPMLVFAALAAPAAGAVFASSCPISDISKSGSALWLLCSEARIATTNDGGGTWREHGIPSQEKLRGLAALDSQRAFAAGDNGTLMVTGNGGQSWRQVPVPAAEQLTSVRFFGESGWVTGWGGVMLHSPDGGVSWESQSTNVTQALEDVYFTDSAHGWAVGWVGTILRTVDGGETWQEIRAPDALWSLSSVYFRDPQNGWAVGFMGQILRSRDGGQTWEKQESPVRSWLKSIHFDNPDQGWISAESGVLVTRDGGDSWQYVEIADRLFLTKLTNLDGSLVAASIQGLVRLTDAGAMLDKPRLIFVFGTRRSEPGGPAEDDISTG